MNYLERAYEICIKKVDLHMKKYNEGVYEFQGACLKGDYYGECGKNDLYHMYNWTTSFITGLAPLLYNVDKNSDYLKWANRFAKDYRNKIFNYSLDTMHDLGFLYSPYSIAMYKLTGDPCHKTTAIKAADELAKRFDIKGRYIDAWNRMDNDQREGRAIIDCMMNLPLLFWAWKETGHTFYRDIAVAHAQTTKKYFVRDDYSIAHSFNFDRETGEMTFENNGCGYGNGSHWARGTAWAVYGFAIAARYLKSDDYYELAVKIAEKYIESIPKGEYIPVWDFRLPKDKPAKIFGTGNEECSWDEANAQNCTYNVDTSAAAIMSCGLMELNNYKANKVLEEFVEKTLVAICRHEYFNNDITVSGILKKQNGQMVYTMYGDYYFVEALQRRLYNTNVCW